MTLRRLLCSVAGCREEIAVCVGGDCRCFPHALRHTNEIRQAQGKPPLVLADDGSLQTEN